MRKKNGFTLVELLAVIVVLAIIMVIAIPSVLDTMNSARRSAFVEYAMKVVRDTQNNYVTDSQSSIPGAGVYIYNIAEDLGYTSHGSYEGYVVVDAKVFGNVDTPHYFIYLHDANYMVMQWDVTAHSSYPDANSLDPYDADQARLRMGDAVDVCNDIGATQCMNRRNYVLSK